jgi:hypothetical protein
MTELKIWGEKTLLVSDRMWKEFNVRYLVRRLLDSRQTPPWMKLSRRSRRRWRGQGGEWVYDPKIFDMLVRAIDEFEGLAAPRSEDRLHEVWVGS